MAFRSQTQRALLSCFIASICTCGLVGIYCLLAGSFGEIQARVMFTTVAVGAASILALANAMPWERRRWHPLGLCGLLAVCAALLLSLGGIWGPAPFELEWFYKLIIIGHVVSVALTHTGLLSLAHLRRQYEWVRVSTVVVIFGLAGQIILSIVFEIEQDGWGRLMGIAGILDVCGTIAVPALHRVSAIHVGQETYTVDLKGTVSLTCPRCAKPQQLPLGRSRCADCGLKLRVEIEEDHCPKCGYSLYKIESAVCPECGTSIAAAPRSG